MDRKLTQLGGCEADNCPKVFLDPASKTVVVQGDLADLSGELGPAGAGEARVMIPLAVLDEAAGKRATLR